MTLAVACSLSQGGRVLAGAARDLDPGAFALVMATGIVSIGAHRLDRDGVAWPLLGLNGLAYVGLWLLVVVRLRVWRARVWHDLSHPARGPGFLTVVAGTCVLGVQVRVLAGAWLVAAGLEALGLALWLGLSYALLAAVVRRGPRRGSNLERGARLRPTVNVNGSWLLLVVASQGVAVLGTLLAADLAAPEPLLLAALLVYLLGSLLYVALVPLLVYRLACVGLRPAQFTPDYWISMGAAAITSLAGATLLTRPAGSASLDELRPFVLGLTLLFWAIATWWIPLLVTLEAWRAQRVWRAWRVWHRRRPWLACGAPAWARVFPLGMYTVATFELARATGWSALRAAPGGLEAVALAAWLLTGLGWLSGRLGGVHAAGRGLPRGAGLIRGTGSTSM